MAEHSSNLRFPRWQTLYQAAIIELNHSKLLERVTEAEHAIFDRLQSLERTPNCESRFAELLAIEDALASLRSLTRTGGLPRTRLTRIKPSHLQGHYKVDRCGRAFPHTPELGLPSFPQECLSALRPEGPLNGLLQR
jgi:hypothetical protein